MVDAIIKATAATGGGAGAGAGGGAVVDDDGSGDGMQCNDHPYRSNSPGGICAFCLQEKLGKLVSNSPSFFIGSSSSSPSFRSDLVPASAAAALRLNSGGGAAAASAAAMASVSTMAATSSSSKDDNSSRCRQNGGEYYDSSSTTSTRRARIPFLLTQKKKKKTLTAAINANGSNSSTTTTTGPSSSSEMVLKRSKSTATPRSGRYFPSSDHDDFTSPRRRGFWSFLHPRKPDHRPAREAKIGPTQETLQAAAAVEVPVTPAAEVAAKRVEYVVVEEVDSSPNSSGGGSNTASFGRKVSRSRSVGCGSRSFSGDFFERISTGFGDCTLRRVESQREGKRASSASRAAGDAIKERVRCGGLFGGFMITSSSSSSSSSSYWASVGDDHRPSGPTTTPGAGPLVHGRTKSWGWAFASPRRAFGKPGTSAITTTTTARDGKSDLGKSSNGASSTSNAPNLAAIPSLLAVRVNRDVSTQ